MCAASGVSPAATAAAPAFRPEPAACAQPAHKRGEEHQVRMPQQVLAPNAQRVHAMRTLPAPPPLLQVRASCNDTTRAQPAPPCLPSQSPRAAARLVAACAGAAARPAARPPALQGRQARQARPRMSRPPRHTRAMPGTAMPPPALRSGACSSARAPTRHVLRREQQQLSVRVAHSKLQQELQRMTAVDRVQEHLRRGRGTTCGWGWRWRFRANSIRTRRRGCRAGAAHGCRPTASAVPIAGPWRGPQHPLPVC